MIYKRHKIRTGGRVAMSALVMGGVLIAAGAAKAQEMRDFTLHAGDSIDVSVWKEDELKKVILVRPDGKFSFPLAGEITAQGKTVAQVQTEITQKLKPYIPEPVVTVTITAFGGNKFYIIGQVNKPGEFIMNPQINVLQALSVAGGTTPFAALNDIIVIRGSGAARRVLPFHYNEVSRGRNLEQNIALESGDVVVVP